MGQGAGDGGAARRASPLASGERSSAAKRHGRGFVRPRAENALPALGRAERRRNLSATTLARSLKLPRPCRLGATASTRRRRAASPCSPHRRHYGVPLLAPSDVLYHAPERRPLQDVLTCIREHRTLENAGRLLEANAERHLKDAAEMARLFRDYPQAIDRNARRPRAARILPRPAPLQIPAGAGRRSGTPATRWSASPGRARRSAIPTACRRRSGRLIAHELALIEELRLRALFPHRPRHRALRPRARASSARAAARPPTPPSATASASPR